MWTPWQRLQAALPGHYLLRAVPESIGDQGTCRLSAELKEVMNEICGQLGSRFGVR